MLSLVLALLVTGVVGGSLLALRHVRRSRDIEEILLHLRIRDRLLADRSLAPWPISVRVELPLWWRSATVVVVTGRVPDPALRDAVLGLTKRILSRRYRRIKTVARIVVDTLTCPPEESVATRPGPAPSVLIAEDDEASRTGLEILLKGWGYRVETATDGQTALEKVLALHPSLVITDIMMPRLSGLEVLQVLRRDRPEIPVIVLSGQDTAKPLLRDTEEGPYGHLRKPIEVQQLRLLMAKALTPHELVTNRRVRGGRADVPSDMSSPRGRPASATTGPRKST